MKIFIAAIVFLLSTSPVFAEMMLFVGDECSHCQRLEQHLAENDWHAKFDITSYEIYHNQANLYTYLQKSKELGYGGGAVPLLIDGNSFVDGTQNIIDYLAGSATERAEQIGATPGTADVLSSLNEEDSAALNEIIKQETKRETSDQNLIAVFAIIFGLGLFGAIVWRAKKATPR